MKKKLFFQLSLLFVFVLFLQHSFAQDSPQWRLPEGVKARLGRGRIVEMRYSPDGTRLAVASSIGIWFYDTTTLQEIDLFTGHTSWVTSIAYSPDGGRWRAVEVGRTTPSVYGMPSRVNTSEPSRDIVGLSLAWHLVRMGKRWQVEAEIRPSVCGMSPRVKKNGVSAIPDPRYRALRLPQMEKRWYVDIRPVRCECGML